MNMLKKFRLRTQMMVCFVLVISVLVLTGFFSIGSMKLLNALALSQLKISQIKIAVLEVRRHEKNFLLGRGEASTCAVHQHIKEIHAISEAEINKKHSCPETKLLLKKIVEQTRHYKKSFDKIVPNYLENPAEFRGRHAQENTFVSNMVSSARTILMTCERLMTVQTRKMAAIQEKAMLIMVFSLVLYLLMAVAVNFMVSRGMLFPLRRCADFARTISVGNLKSSLKIDSVGSARVLADSLNAMQEQLKRRIGFAEGILNGMVAPFAVVDIHENISYLNHAMLELFEIEGSKALYIGQPWSSFVYDDLNKETLMGKVLKENRAQRNLLMSIQTRKRNIRHIRIDINTLYDLDGNAMGSFCIMADLTPMKEEQEKLRRAHLCLQSKKRELELILDNIDTQVWYTSGDVYQFANNARLKFLGKTFEEVKGKNIYGFRFKEEIDKLKRYNARVINTRGTVNFEDWFLNGSGVRRLLSITKVPMLDVKNNVDFIITTARDITEQKQLEEQLTYKCYHDQLTDLYNRHYLIEEIERLRKSRLFPLGIIFCDVDDMKLINDTLGHQFGDKLLKNVARLMKKCFRGSDMLARYGGDEFVVLQPESSEADLVNAVSRFRMIIEKYNDDNMELPIKISMGYVVSKNKNEPVKNLLASADNLMYQEKIGKKQGAKGLFKLEGLLKALEARDYMTEEHGGRMGERITRMCRGLELSKATEHNFFLLAIFHDIGKIGIPDKILFKPGPLNKIEWQTMKEHSKIGHRIAESTPELSHIAEWILHHHEKYDGTGYPSGLKGNDIPLACRILAIVDAYDAMVSDRVYRKAMSHEDALMELRNESGTQFDPWLVDKFIQIVEMEFAPTDGR